MYMCVNGIDIASFYAFFIDFGTVLTMCYFCFLHFLLIKYITLVYRYTKTILHRTKGRKMVRWRTVCKQVQSATDGVESCHGKWWDLWTVEVFFERVHS